MGAAARSLTTAGGGDDALKAGEDRVREAAHRHSLTRMPICNGKRREQEGLDGPRPKEETRTK